MIKRNFLISIAFLACSCTDAPPCPVCHGWTETEIAQLKKEDAALPHDSIFRTVMKDYEGICIQ